MKNHSSNSGLLIVGSVAFDSIETPFGKVNKTLGGSASYFSLAASAFAKTRVVGVVGKDFSDKYQSALKKHNIDLSGLQQSTGKTFAWGGKYSFDLNNRDSLFTRLNVMADFEPQLLPRHQYVSHVFLGNMPPAVQLKTLRQIKSPKLVGLDTMNFWIEKTPKDLAKILKLVDVFVINDSEARELSGQHNLVKAAKKIISMMKATSPRPSPHHLDKLGVTLSDSRMGHKGREAKILIIKRGEYGLLMFQPLSPSPSGRGVRGEGSIRIFHLPGFPLEDVIDPTGAGDSFAGGFMGYLAKTKDHSWENLKRACVAGSVMASFCCEQLGTARLQNLKTADINRRVKDFKLLTEFGNT